MPEAASVGVKLVVLLVSGITLCVYALASIQAFEPDPDSPPRVLVVRALGAIVAIGHLAFIAVAPALPLANAAASLVLYAVALVLFLWTWETVRTHPIAAAFSRRQPERVVVHGPFRFVRHPFYASYLLVWFAGVLVTAHPWVLVSALVMTAVYAAAALEEEARFARSDLAQAYRDYQARTGLFIPRWSRGPRPGADAWDAVDDSLHVLRDRDSLVSSLVLIVTVLLVIILAAGLVTDAVQRAQVGFAAGSGVAR